MRMHVNSRILLVEDDPTIVKTLTEFLKLEGFFVWQRATDFQPVLRSKQNTIFLLSF